MSLSAQKKYTLNECMTQVLNSHPDIVLQNLNILRMKNSTKQSEKSRLPTVSASISNGLNGGRSIDPFSNSFVQRMVSYNSFGISGSWNLFNGFWIKNQILQNKTNLEAEQIQLEVIKKELKFAVVEAFMNVVMNQDLVHLQQENEKDLLGQVKSVKERIKEGILARYNLIETEAQLTNAGFELINAQNNLKLSKVILGQLMMLKEEDFDIIVPEIPYSILSTLELNLSSHPVVRTLEKRILSTQYSIRVAQADRLPKLSLNVGLATSYSSAAIGEFTYFRQLSYNFNQYVGLGLSIPVYNNIQPRIETVKIEEKIARKQKEKQEIGLRQWIETLSLEINTLSERVENSQQSVNAYSVLYDAAKEKYKEGLINNIELNTYRLNLEKAKIQQIQTKVELFYKIQLFHVFNE